MNETLQILEKINNFYSSAYSQLIIFTTGLLAFVGGLIPFAISFYQNKQFKREQSLLKEEMKMELDILYEDLQKRVSELVEKTNENLAKKVAEQEKELLKKIAKTEGGTFHIQGTSLAKDKDYTNASMSYCTAIIEYIKGEDELNLQRVISSILDQCFPFMNKTHFTADLIETMESAINDLVSFNVNDRYTDKLSLFKKAKEDATSREGKILGNNK